eukprot:TCONS_00057612-protein
MNSTELAGFYFLTSLIIHARERLEEFRKEYEMRASLLVNVWLTLTFSVGCVKGSSETDKLIHQNSQTYDIITSHLLKKRSVDYISEGYLYVKQKSIRTLMRSLRSVGKSEIKYLRSKRDTDGMTFYPQSSNPQDYVIGLTIAALFIVFVASFIVIFYYWGNRYCP